MKANNDSLSAEEFTEHVNNSTISIENQNKITECIEGLADNDDDVIEITKILSTATWNIHGLEEFATFKRVSKNNRTSYDFVNIFLF